MEVPAAVSQRVGPLKTWQWVALGAGAIVFVVMIKRMRSGATGGNMGPISIVPQLDFSGKSPLAGLQGGILDELSEFICMMPNAPNNFELSMPDGSILNVNNGVPTFGSGAAVLRGPGQDHERAVRTSYNPCEPRGIPPESPPNPNPFPAPADKFRQPYTMGLGNDMFLAFGPRPPNGRSDYIYSNDPGFDNAYNTLVPYLNMNPAFPLPARNWIGSWFPSTLPPGGTYAGFPTGGDPWGRDNPGYGGDDAYALAVGDV
jgi:hypothetical protein